MNGAGMSSETPPLANRRPQARKRAFLGCTVVYGENGAYSFPCVIRNVAPGGARLGFDLGHTPPSRFWLVNGRDRTAHRVHIVWATGTEVGVEMEAGYPLHQLPPELAYLKRFIGRVS